MYSAVHHRLDKNQELNEIYWAWSLKSLGLSFVSIFLPIYLYSLGFRVTSLMFFFFLLHGIRIFIEPFSGWLVARYGPKHIMALSFYLLLLQLALFLTLPQMHWPLWCISFVSAVGLSTHFVSLHTDFSAMKSNKGVGQQLSRLNELANLGSAIGPLAGGLIALYFGIQFSFVAALVVLSFAVLPLFRTKDAHVRHPYSFGQVRLKPIWRDLVSQAGAGIDSVLVNTLWPFAIFLVVGSYATVGAFTTIALLLTLVVSMVVGRLVDEGHWRGLIRFGSIGTALVHFLRAFSATPITVALATIVGDLAYWFLNIPYLAAYYEHADRPDRIEYVVVMEMATEIGRASFWLCLLLISLVSTTQLALTTAFIIGAVASCFIMLIRPPRTLLAK